MAREIDLLGYWMPVLRQLKEFKEIAKAETPELKYILEQIERTLNNMFIETADEYGIKRFEDIMGIYPEAGASLETRRFNVLVKWNDKVPYTEKELYNRLISICGDDNFSVNPDYKNYFLEIITHLGIEGAFDTISSILQDMIPCNLVLDLKNTLEEGNTTPFSVAVVSCVAMRYQITNDINPKVVTESPMYYGVGLGRAGTHIITHDIKSRFYISPIPKAGFKPVDGFLDDNGILQDKIYLSAFEGSIFDTSAGAYLKADEQVADFATDMLSSIAGAKPASGLTQNLTRANVRKLCTNRGKGWKSHNIFALTATQWLILVEYASMNAQSVIGQGVSTFTDDGSTNMAVVTGATSGLGNGSGIDPNAGVDGKCSVSYRGEENLWGNIWTWLDAINIYNDKASGVYNAFVKPYGECKDDTTADGYKALDFNIATGEGYISGFGYDEDHPDLFLCAEHNGASNLPVGDYYWNNNDGFRVARLGGIWGGGTECGAWYLYLTNTSSTRYRDIGGRLLYVPQTKISA